MGIKAINHVWQNSKQSGSSLLLLLAIADFADDNGECYPSIPTLAKKCRCSQRYVQTLTKQLITDGELEIDANQGRKTSSGYTNLYRLKGVNNGSPLYAKKGVKNSSPLDAKTPKGVNSNSPDEVNNGSPKPSLEPSITESDKPTVAPALSLADQFHALIAELRETKNKPAVLRLIYILCFGENSAPDYSYLGKVAKGVGGAGYLAQRMFELVTRPPNGDVLAYIQAEHRNKLNRMNGNGKEAPTINSTWTELESNIPDYMEQ